MPEPWFHMALDQFRDGMPDRYRGLNSPDKTPGSRGLNVVPTTIDNKRLTEVHFGDIGQSMLRGMHRAIAAFVSAGNKVIIDDLMLTPYILKDYIRVFTRYQVLFVGVRCPLKIVNDRESTRVGRFPGTAESHFHTVHAHSIYDLEVDTHMHKPLACARQIRDHIAGNIKTHAFNTLRNGLKL